MAKEHKKVLIVEDEKPLLDILYDKLTEEGYEVFKAENGKEGLELAVKEKPDLVLLDIIMPEMDGVTMLRKLRETKEGKDMDVVILTNLPSPGAVGEGVEDKNIEFFVKSDWHIGEILNEIKSHINEGKSQ